MNLVNVGYGSTNYYAISLSKKYLLIDAGMPGTLGMMKKQLGRHGVHPEDIQYLIVTHFHPDHCGIAQELQAMGIEMIVGRTQLDYLEAANQSLKKFPDYKDIVVKSHNVLSENDESAFFEKLGVPGHLLHTPGHSDDSISIVIEGLGVFTGDLPLFNGMSDEADEKVGRSWARIRNTHEKWVFPGHGNRMEMN